MTNCLEGLQLIKEDRSHEVSFLIATLINLSITSIMDPEIQTDVPDEIHRPTDYCREHTAY